MSEPKANDPKSQETRLDAKAEKQFWLWLADEHSKGHIQEGDYRHYKAHGYGYDYDFRAVFQSGKEPKPNSTNGHWDDLGKKTNHPTFSTESKYFKLNPEGAGTWGKDDKFIPAKQLRDGIPAYDAKPRYSPRTLSDVPTVSQKVNPDGTKEYENVNDRFPKVADNLLFRLLKSLGHQSEQMAKRLYPEVDDLKGDPNLDAATLLNLPGSSQQNSNVETVGGNG